MVVGIVLGATVLANSSFGPANAFAASATPTPSFKSNENPAHEKVDSAAQEAAENSGQRPFGGGFNGQSNEDPTNEKSDSPPEKQSKTWRPRSRQPRSPV